MLDIKHIDSAAHKELTGIGNERVLAFAQHLCDLGIPMWVRHVVVPGITDDENELFSLGKKLAEYKNLKALDILPYHDMAKPKYENLGIPYPLGDTPPLTKQEAIRAKEIVIRGIKEGLKNESANS